MGTAIPTNGVASRSNRSRSRPDAPSGHDPRGSFRRDIASVGPLFFGVVDASLDRLLEGAALMLASPLDDGPLANSKDRPVGSGLGEMLHLVEIGSIIEQKRGEVRVDLNRDGLP